MISTASMLGSDSGGHSPRRSPAGRHVVQHGKEVFPRAEDPETRTAVTVANLEHRIDELADHNTQLQREFAAMSDRLDGQLGEAEALRKALQERDRRLAEMRCAAWRA